MGKTRDLFKKMETSREHARIGTIKDRENYNLTKAEEIKKRWHRKTTQKRS